MILGFGLALSFAFAMALSIECGRREGDGADFGWHCMATFFGGTAGSLICFDRILSLLL